MDGFELLAELWWVNFLIVVPFAAYVAWRREADLIKREVYTAKRIDLIGKPPRLDGVLLSVYDPGILNPRISSELDLF